MATSNRKKNPYKKNTKTSNEKHDDLISIATSNRKSGPYKKYLTDTLSEIPRSTRFRLAAANIAKNVFDHTVNDKRGKIGTNYFALCSNLKFDANYLVRKYSFNWKL